MDSVGALRQVISTCLARLASSLGTAYFSLSSTGISGMQHIWLELELYNMLLAALHVFPCLIPSQVSGLNRNPWWQWKMGGEVL